jgi:tRNA nucleotidyltransferase/poly(A) polymerase
MRTAVQARMLEQLNRGRLRKELLAMLDEPEPVACLTSLGQWLLGAHVR